jgi:hypothetical protein
VITLSIGYGSLIEIYLQLAVTTSVNEQAKTEPATFSMMPCWVFFRVSVFLFSLFLVLFKS